MSTLGRLEPVKLRDVWESEAGNFTPWLAQEENIKLLGDTIGMELEVETTEQQVGPFRADILCKETTSEHWVLIENQLERTDHTHLGQLMTYAAGLDAVTVIWIAERFTDEHRAALDWLNEITQDNVSFFGLEVELWKIGGSPAAPKFNIVSKPNDWTRTFRESAHSSATSQTKELQLEFWTHFISSLPKSFPVRPGNPQRDSFMKFSSGHSGFSYSTSAARWDHDAGEFLGVLRVELWIAPKKGQSAFDALFSQKEQIESEFGESLRWDRKERTSRYRVYVSRKADVEDQQEWPQHHKWLTEKLDALHAALAPRFKTLPYDIPGSCLNGKHETPEEG